MANTPLASVEQVAAVQSPAEKAARLLGELKSAKRKAGANRWFRRLWGKVFWYSAVACTAAASLRGFIAKAAFAAPYIEPWMVSLLAAAGGAIEVFRDKTVWRDEKDAYAEYRDTLSGLITRLTFEMPDEPDRDQIAAIARESRLARQQLTQELKRINKKAPRLPIASHGGHNPI